MNTNVSAKRVLLYGDSLVYGKISGENGRLAINVRYSGVLQSLLGADFEVVDEGLRARTLCGENYFFEERNGLSQFGPIIGSHLPLDLVIIALGTNNANAKSDTFKTVPVEEALSAYIEKVKKWSEFLNQPEPKIMFISPPHINENALDNSKDSIFQVGAQQKVEQIQQAVESYCKQHDIACVKAHKVCVPDEADGIHLNEVGNRQLALALCDQIVKIL
jgi:lysophospholipase L1-like esterase